MRSTRAAVRRAGSSLLLLALVMLGATSDGSPVRDLQARIDAASPGEVIELAAGEVSGPLRITRPVVLRGAGTVDAGGQGTALVVAAAGARVEGLTVRNSGEDIGAPDACIYIEAGARGAVVSGNRLERCGFGIWVHETDGAQILDNRIESRAELREADRGNGIHLFNASNLVVRGNHVEDARDGIYVSATEDSLIQENRVRGVRFGIHYMYSYRNRIIGNEIHDNKVGVALMESRDLVVDDNHATGNDRNGIMFRDVLASKIRRNRLEGNGNGMFFYSSTENLIQDNQVLGNEMGLKVWAGSRRNVVEGNVIRGNREQVFYVGAEDQVWGESGRGNEWGDYLGWDQDGDGVGDRPHRVDSFTAALLVRFPAAILLLRSPALEFLSHLSDRLPMLRSPTIIDRAPLLDAALP